MGVGLGCPILTTKPDLISDQDRSKLNSSTASVTYNVIILKRVSYLLIENE